MRIHDQRQRTGCAWMGVGAAILMVMLNAHAAARSMSPHHGFLGGPWEVVVKMGHEGQTLRLPIEVADENKAQDLDAAVPVMGTPIKVRLQRYLPNLKQETIAVDDPNGGAVAKLSFRGEGLEQDLWLSAQQPNRQSISSHIGGVAIRELPTGSGRAEILEQWTRAETMGVLIATPPGSQAPQMCSARPGAALSLPGTSCKITVLRYVPHYSINRETKEVASASDKPVNPAVEIKIENGEKASHEWLWSKFPASPHKRLAVPFPIRFMDLHLPSGEGQHLLVLARGEAPRVLYEKDGRRQIEQIETGQRLPFKDSRYSFAVEEMRFGASVQTRWANGSDVLLKPALLATVGSTDKPQEVALELNKPYHHKTASGTLVVLYRRVSQ